jgi:pyruvate/2-oxoglutarate dehydrogenase complex dihydrolipoamide acyltransferase (E2) component
MDYDIVVPSTADGSLQVTIVSWIRKPGDGVEMGQDLAEASTEKITLYITAPVTGVVTNIAVAEGEKAGVGNVVGTMSDGKEE